MGVMKNLSQQILDSGRRTIAGANEGLPFEITIDDVKSDMKANRLKDETRLQQFNDDVKKWVANVKQELKSNVASFVSNGGSNLSKSISGKVYKKQGEAYRIGFSFRREGIYLHYGSGREYAGSVGSHWIDRYGVKRETNPNAKFNQGTGKRRAMPWFDPVIERNINALADIVANYSADLAVDATHIFITKK